MLQYCYEFMGFKVSSFVEAIGNLRGYFVCLGVPKYDDKDIPNYMSTICVNNHM